MTQHFTRNTISSSFYCPTCRKPTQHRIDDKRKGPCLDCIDRLEREHDERVLMADAQGEMFPKDKAS